MADQIKLKDVPIQKKESNSITKSSSPKNDIVIFVEGGDSKYAGRVTTLLDQIGFQIKIVSEYSDNEVTHYVVDSNTQFGTTKGYRYYSAISKGMWILQPQWFWCLLEKKFPPSEMEYLFLSREVDFSPQPMKLFLGVGFVYVHGLVYEDFKFNIIKMLLLVEKNGAKTFWKSKSDLMQKKRNKEFDNLNESYIITTNLGIYSNFCTSCFSKLGIQTVHPDVILTSIEKQKPIDESNTFPTDKHRYDII